MGRYDLTDFEWRIIKPLLPNTPRGVPARFQTRNYVRVIADNEARVAGLHFGLPPPSSRSCGNDKPRGQESSDR